MAVNRKTDLLTIDVVANKKGEVAIDERDSECISNASHESLHDSKSSGYVVKKITGSTRLGGGLKEKKSGLHSVSIDSDSFGNPSSYNAPVKKQTASIDTDAFDVHHTAKNQGYPVIVDETDVCEEQVAAQRNPAVARKEKIQPHRSISLDISNDIGSGVMPSAERQEQLGSGIVTGVLGSGGMAKVYKIWNEKLEVHRAVKVLLPTSQKEQLDRFLTEAKITAKLHHPNIIETYDCSEWKGLPIIEMELIDGYTLSALVGAHAVLPVPVSVAIALQVACALSYAHAQELMIYGKTYRGIIHRDLKPSNIMVTPAGRVTLMDFGVARPLETGLHTVVTDSIVGTIHYFSPEQIGGYPIDHLTDVYSFGAVLYELLCGKNPFPYSNMVSMIQAKTKNQFIRLEEFALDIDSRVASVAHTCLRTDKRERFGSFSEIISVLTEILSSFGMGSAGDVVAGFLRNPGKSQMEYERYRTTYRSMQQVQAEQPAEPVLPVEPASAVKGSGSPQWEPRKKSAIGVAAIAVVAALAIIACCIVYVGRTGKRADSGATFGTAPDNLTVLAHGNPEHCIHTSLLEIYLS